MRPRETKLKTEILKRRLAQTENIDSNKLDIPRNDSTSSALSDITLSQINSGTGFVFPNKNKINQVTFRNITTIKKDLFKQKNKITSLLLEHIKKNKKKEQIDTAALIVEYNNLILLMLEFLDNDVFTHRSFKKNIDQNQKYFFELIIFVLQGIDNIIAFCDDIFNNLMTIHPIWNSSMTNSITDLFNLSHMLCYCLEYSFPITITPQFLNTNLGFIEDLIKNQLYLLKCLKNLSNDQIKTLSVKFHPVNRLFQSTIYMITTENLNKILQQKLVMKALDRDLDILNSLSKISILMHHYSEINRHDKAHKHKIIDAQNINYYFSFSIANPYLHFYAEFIKDSYYKFTDFSYYMNGDIDKFKNEIKEFIDDVSLVLWNLPKNVDSILTNDILFMDAYDKFISIDYNLLEVLISIQQVFYILNLLIKKLQSSQVINEVILHFQQQQIQLLESVKSILHFLQQRGYDHISQWTYLENEKIVNINIVIENFKKRNPALTSNKVSVLDGFSGFPINVLLAIVTNFSTMLTGNYKIKQLDFPESVNHEQISQHYIELMESEAKEAHIRPEEKKHSQKLTKKSFLKPKKPIENKSSILLPPKENKKTVTSKEQQAFDQIRSKFTYFIAGKKDQELTSLINPLFKTCTDRLLLINMNDFLSAYFLSTSEIEHSKKPITDPALLRRVYFALFFKKNAMDLFEKLHEREKNSGYQIFLETEYFAIQQGIEKSKQAHKKSAENNSRKLKYLEKQRAEKIQEMGYERWRNNPNPKNIWANERKKLIEKAHKLGELKTALDETISLWEPISTKQAFSSLATKTNKKTHTVSTPTQTPSPTLETKQHEIVLSNEKITTAIDTFYENFRNMVKVRMNFHGITEEPEYFFPRTTLEKTIRLITQIKESASCKNNHYHSYVVGGLCFKMFQKKSVVEQPFNFMKVKVDVDIITDIPELPRIFSQNKLDYKVKAITSSFSSFELNQDNVHFDIVSIPKLDPYQNSHERNLNTHAIYMEIMDNELTPFFLDHDELFDNMIDNFLLDVKKDNFIHVGKNHLANIDIHTLLPKWNTLQQWLIKQSFEKEFIEESMIPTIKCFVKDPVIFLHISLLLIKKMVKFTELDLAIQLCLNHSDENFLLSMIFEGHYRHTNTKGMKVFDQYIKHLINKCDLFNGQKDSSSQLINSFSNLMEWAFEKKFFLEILTFPIKTCSSLEHYAKIEETCRLLFSNNVPDKGIYSFLKKQFIELHLNPFHYSLEIKMLPFVIAFVITSNQDPGITQNFNKLINAMSKIAETFDGLNDLYPELSRGKISSEVEVHLQQFIAINQKNHVSSLTFLKPPLQRDEKNSLQEQKKILRI